MTELLTLGQSFRKKYCLALLIFVAGFAHAFLYSWSAGEVTMFATVLLGIFGGADLVDKKVPNK